LVLLTPWFFGSVHWTSQQVIFWAATALLGTLPMLAIAKFIYRKAAPRVPWTSWVFLSLAAWAWLQSQPFFSVENHDGWSPPSVAMQRWALGITESPAAISDRTIELHGFEPNRMPCDLAMLDSSKLAWSIEPLHTRGAVFGMLVCSLMCYCGSSLFSSKRGQLSLFIVLTVIGVAIGCFGLHGAFSYQAENFLGLQTGGSFASFRSKNSAGGFLNICIAGCIGLVAWTMTFLKRKRTDLRYQFSDASTLMRIRGAVEDFLSDLNTPQIASLLCLITIVFALIMSLCRGAAVGALVGIIGASLLVNHSNKGRGNWIPVLILLLTSIGCMLAFQVDDDSLKRLESLAELDLEMEALKGRSYVWGMAWSAMSYYGLLGSGLGTFHFAYLPFQNPSSPGWFYHAESLYAQCGVELGYIGLAVLIIAIISSFLTLQKRVPTETWKSAYPAKIAGAYLLLSQSSHSAVDFAVIFPALFIPACLLHGAVSESIRQAIASGAKPSDKRETVTVVVREKRSRRTLAFSVMLFLLMGGLGYLSYASLANLAAGEQLEFRARQEDKAPIGKRQPGRVTRLLQQWPLDTAALKENPQALKTIADASIFDFRMNQLLDIPASVPPETAWPNTMPIFMQLGLDRDSTPDGQAKIVELAGGPAAIQWMEQASSFYARANLHSPLDWRLSWGRCLTALRCSRDDMARVLPAVDCLGRHVPNLILNASFLFRKQLSDEQVDKVWKQAMRTNPASAVEAAKMIVAERDIETLDIGIFPQRTEILVQLAQTVLTKSKFPELHDQLWKRAIELLEKLQMSEAATEIWLANAALALDDLKGEINHLRVAVRLQPTNVELACRLIECLIKVGEYDQAKDLYDKANKFEPSNKTLESIKAKLR
jgi:tetratricopeptide (TPR) repeat protein